MSRVSESVLADAIVRIVTEDITLEQERHGDALIVLDSAFDTTCNIILPQATGSGRRYTIYNNAVQTNTLNFTCRVATDYLSGDARMMQDTEITYVFFTSATSDKMVLNATTTGGLRGDNLEFIDYRPGYFLVRAHINANGNAATPFSAT